MKPFLKPFLRPLTLALLFCGSTLAFAGDGTASFFQPRFSVDTLERLLRESGQERIQMFIDEGGEGEVYVVARREGDNTEISALKRFAVDGIIERNLETLKQLYRLEAAGYLGPFKVIKIHSVDGNDLTMEYVPGESITDLHLKHSSNPEFQKVWKAYTKGVQEVAKSMRSLGYDVRTSNGLPPTCHELMGFSRDIADSNMLVYNDFEAEDIYFSIEPLNVLVSSETGEFYIIDPY